MKQRILTTMCAIAFGLACLQSCNFLSADDYLHEVENLNDIWTERSSLRKAWAACYGAMPSFADPGVWMSSVNYDEMHMGRDAYAVSTFAWGRQTADNPIFNLWSGQYRAIRTCNMFLENCYQADDKLLKEGEVEGYALDVRFLRAFYYSLLLENYGPFVIVDHTVDYSDADNYPTTRASIDDCVDFILSDLAICIDGLPDTDMINGEDLGRPSKQAAMALKAHVLLWAASPLVNGNPDYASFVDKEGRPYVNIGTPDMNKWKKAADAAKALIDEGKFEIYTVPANDGYATVPLGSFAGNDVSWPEGPAGIDPYRSYKGLFEGGDSYWNSEVIWQVSVPNQMFLLTQLAYPRSYYQINTYYPHYYCATQKQVDAFFMNDGRTIEEATDLYVDYGPCTDGDGYYINGLGNTVSYATPVITGFKVPSSSTPVTPVPNKALNREARFYANIGFQGRGYIGGSNEIYYGDYRADMADGYIITDKASARTCWTIYKWGSIDLDRRGTGSVEKPFPIFRLAEMYLAYAEALNEIDPGNPDILHYLNLIRYRAGLPGYADGATQEQVRNWIKHERYVEFAFEGKRYYDSRRWKDAELTGRDNWGNSLGMGGLVYGCNYTVNNSDFYERYAVDGYVFKKRQYFLPIPYSEVSNHWGELVQNPGW